LANKTTIIIEHDVNFVRKVGGTVTVMHRGSVLAEGSFNQIACNEAVRKIYLGQEA
jgi:ABC-type uncharacterized transport system ATPase subunit